MLATRSDALLALPQVPSTWIGVRHPFASVWDDSRLDLCAWVDLNREEVRCVRVVPRGQQPDLLLEMLEDAMLRPDAGLEPARPEEIGGTLDRAGLDPLIDDLGLSWYGDPNAAFLASVVLSAAHEATTGSAMSHGYLVRDDLRPSQVKRLFEAAAGAVGVLERLPVDAVVRIDGLGKAPTYVCVAPRALIICGSDRSLKSYFGTVRERALHQGRYLVLRYCRPHEAGAAVYGEARANGWPLASEDAVPLLNLSDRRVGMLATKAEIERAVQVLDALAGASLDGLADATVGGLRVRCPGTLPLTRPVPAGPEDVLDLKVTLLETDVWRRLRVPASFAVADLHELLQDAMGWERAHLYSFVVDGRTYGEGNDDFDAGDVTLEELSLCVGDRFLYEYDFGDGWRHELQVERVHRGGERRAEVVDGANACPPEDCGGPRGYQELQQRGLRPTRLDLARVNRLIQNRVGIPRV